MTCANGYRSQAVVVNMPGQSELTIAESTGLSRTDLQGYYRFLSLLIIYYKLKLNPLELCLYTTVQSEIKAIHMYGIISGKILLSTSKAHLYRKPGVSIRKFMNHSTFYPQ